MSKSSMLVPLDEAAALLMAMVAETKQAKAMSADEPAMKPKEETDKTSKDVSLHDTNASKARTEMSNAISTVAKDYTRKELDTQADDQSLLKFRRDSAYKMAQVEKKIKRYLVIKAAEAAAKLDRDINKDEVVPAAVGPRNGRGAKGACGGKRKYDGKGPRRPAV
jgi:hypothetical protein